MISEASLLGTGRPGLEEQRQATLPPPLLNEFMPTVGGRRASSCSPPTCQHHQARVAKQHVPGPGWLAESRLWASALAAALAAAAPAWGAAWGSGKRSLNHWRPPATWFFDSEARYVVPSNTCNNEHPSCSQVSKQKTMGNQFWRKPACCLPQIRPPRGSKRGFQGENVYLNN